MAAALAYSRLIHAFCTADVAQDEFDCFDKPQPECPTPNLTLPTLLVLAGLTFLTWLHHHMTTPKFELECTLSEEYEKREDEGAISELEFQDEEYLENIPINTLIRKRVTNGLQTNLR